MRLYVDDYLQVRYVNLYNEKVQQDIKVMAIGDVHISDMVSFKKIEKLKSQILKEKADYIVFVGDLIDRVEEIKNNDSFSKLNDLLKFSVSVAPTFVILGNHDYIQRETHNSHLEGIRKVIKDISGVILLDNDIYYDDKIWFMGYTETKEYYVKKENDFKAFYDNFKSHDLLYKKVDTKLPTIALIHSPEFSNDEKNKSLLKDYDLIISGHTHDGCIPFGFGNFKRGIISPKKTFFPKNVRGLRKIGNNYILITGGIVKIQKCAHKLLHPFNHLCPMQMDVITLSNKKNVNVRKKWY